jgi:hypothetical protein
MSESRAKPTAAPFQGNAARFHLSIV